MEDASGTAVVAGIGQLGSEFALGLLRLGRTVVPVTRARNLARVLEAARDVELILLAVGETALVPLLGSIPPRVKDRVALVQNELVPADWQRAGYVEVSGVVVWFEKKAGRPIHVVRPSVAYGPRSGLLLELLGELKVPAHAVAPDALEFELALKNLYILVHNLAGLAVQGTVGSLWQEHAAWAREVASDVLRHQEVRFGRALDRGALLDELDKAVRADPGHGLAGRTAPERLSRVLSQARQAGIQLPALEQLNDRLDESLHA
ncbi:MAG TPA: hypothetical protein VFU02_10435 [Polyangiaceae bacterium]|nr:hypothetical protein [Polyangiaceae bacterium]